MVRREILGKYFGKLWNGRKIKTGLVGVLSSLPSRLSPPFTDFELFYNSEIYRKLIT